MLGTRGCLPLSLSEAKMKSSSSAYAVVSRQFFFKTLDGQALKAAVGGSTPSLATMFSIS